MAGHALVIAVSIGSAVFFAGSSSLKHVSAGAVPDAQGMQPGKLARFVRATVTHRLWLAGIACDTVGLGLQVVALHLGALAVVQPLLISGLVFALMFRWLLDRAHVTRSQAGWALLLTGCLAAFVAVAAHPTAAANPEVDRLPAGIAAGTGVLLAAACVALGRRLSSRGHAAALLGAAVGLIYAATAALLKAATDILVAEHWRLLLSWQLYAVIALGALGLLLNQLAFQAGPLAASLPATATVDPLASIVIGVVVYDEHIARLGASGLLLVVLLLALGGSAIQLVRASPTITEGGAGERTAEQRTVLPGG